MDPRGIAQNVWDQFVTVWHAPVPTLAVVLISWWAIWKIMEWRYAAIIERLKDHNTHLERAVRRPAQAIGPATPNPPAVTVSFESEPLSFPSEREFLPLGVTPESISKARRDLTGMQADKLFAGYVGKWMKVEGTVQKTGFSDDQTIVTLSFGDGIEFIRDTATIYFDGEVPEVGHLMPGAQLSAQGMVEHIGVIGMILVHCEIA